MTLDANSSVLNKPHTKSRPWLWIAAACTLAATAWVGWQDDKGGESVQPAARRTGSAAPATSRINNTANTMTSASQTAASVSKGWPVLTRESRSNAWPAVTSASVAAWNGWPVLAPTVALAPRLAARPTQPVVLVPAAPQAPAFPYTLIGVLDDGEPQALLTSPTRSFGVKANEVLDGQWRIDAVQARGVTLTWLPGGIQKTLAFTSS